MDKDHAALLILANGGGAKGFWVFPGDGLALAVEQAVVLDKGFVAFFYFF